MRRYTFDVVHPAAKCIGANFDVFMCGMDPLGLLLWWGDVAAARAGFAKVLDAQKRVLARVRLGETTAEECARYRVFAPAWPMCNYAATVG